METLNVMLDLKEEKVDQDQNIIHFYRDKSTEYADYSGVYIKVTPEDEISINAYVVSKGYETRKSGPHFIITLSDGNNLNIGEFHWNCGHIGDLTFRKQIKGIYGLIETRPTLNMVIPHPYKCG